MFQRLLRNLFRSPKNTSFVSDLDTFMAKERAMIPLSLSQKQEIAKAKAIAQKRDHKSKNDASNIWAEF